MTPKDPSLNFRNNQETIKDPDIDPIETQEWLSSLKAVAEYIGNDRAVFLLKKMQDMLQHAGVTLPFTANTPYINTIPHDQEPPYPGDPDIERSIKSIIRWNAMAMVVSGNREHEGIGGHISSYASAATLYEVGFNHFFQAKTSEHSGDQIYFQGHCSPGIYARAFLEGRIHEQQMKHFRRELAQGGGLSSYPHPWLMPNFWEFPTVSMGLSPLMAIYQARFNRYLESRSLLNTSASTVWAFLGDGETDEPESLGSLTLASRESLDNLIFVINCNLQRLDGPVRGNGKIIQELEAVFRGAGWNVIKVIWGSNWDPLIEKDIEGRLVKIMNETVDGEYQKYKASDGKYIREHFFGKDSEVKKMVEHLSDEEIWRLKRGGHDKRKIYSAYSKALIRNGKPTVILAKTIKGYGLGESGEGRNVTHQQKKLNEDELKKFRSRFNIPIPEDMVNELPFYKPPENSREIQYLKQKRQQLGGYIPKRTVQPRSLELPEASVYDEFLLGSGERKVSTTMGFVSILSKLLRQQSIGKHIVPIIPDEARTFGMEALFRQYGIYSMKGQLYEPVDKASLLYYYETKNGQILEEGITEAGAMSSFIAAGTSYATHRIHTIPFFAFYSMFGFQRIGDLIWAAADMRTHGFLIGATAGRTTLNGEGLQHQDGHSHLLASVIPNLLCYDPAYVYEFAIIIQDGLKRMIEQGEDIFYYLTSYNENYEQIPMPKGAEDGIKKGLYKLISTTNTKKALAQIISSGVMVKEAILAANILEKDYHIPTNVWSAPSFKRLRLDALYIEKNNRLNPQKKASKNYIEEILSDEGGAFVAVSDYISLVPDQIQQWIPGGLLSLGTDGFGRSSTREELRKYFSIDKNSIIYSVLYRLYKMNEINLEVLTKAQKELGILPSAVHSLDSLPCK